MTFQLTEEQESIRRTARDFVRERAPVAQLRKLRDERDPVGFSRAVWREMASLGFAGLVIPEAWGGAGLGYAELGLVLEECGRTLAATPLSSTVLLAGNALLLGGTDAQRRAWLPRACAGDAVLALAHAEGLRHAPYAVAARAERAASGFVLRGEKSFVLDAHVADALVVVARTSGAAGDRAGLTLFLVPRDACGLRVARLEVIDGRNAARVLLEDVVAREADVVGAIDAGADVLDAVLDRATAGLAAEMLGGIQETFDRTIAHLKTRKQFDVFIGSFQALKHRAAQMFCEIELTKSIVMEALRAIDAGSAEVPLLVSAAKARASDVFVHVANEAVQMHGGIGVTDDLDIGLFLKRARVAQATFGAAAYHRDRFARLRGY